MLYGSRCPQCRKKVKFTDNFALQTMIEESNPEEYKERLREYMADNTVSGRIEDMQQRWPDTRIVLRRGLNDKTVMTCLSFVRVAPEQKKNLCQVMQVLEIQGDNKEEFPKYFIGTFSSGEHGFEAGRNQPCLAVICDGKCHVVTCSKNRPLVEAYQVSRKVKPRPEVGSKSSKS